jgi:hypothetical protein
MDGVHELLQQVRLTDLVDGSSAEMIFGQLTTLHMALSWHRDDARQAHEVRTLRS